MFLKMSLLCQLSRNLLQNCEKVYLLAPKLASLYQSLLTPTRNYVQLHDYKNDTKEKFIPFDKLTSLRREEARRSILVQVNSEESFAELQSYCLQFGDIQGVYHFVVTAGHFMLIEFAKELDVQSVLKTSNHVEGTGVPIRSPFLWFRAENNATKTKKKQRPQDMKLLTVDGLSVPKENEVCELLQNANSVDQQILILHKSTCLNDLGIRLRYFAARQVELGLCGLFPNITVRPFGSSVSGFGKQGCDLDLVLRFESDQHKVETSRFVFHTKNCLNNGRSNVQRQMEVVGDLLQLFTPGCANVRRILQARVPIIKYFQEYVGLECDLSMTNLTGVYMSELLYILGCIDSRVCPLMFAVRKWAQCVGLTNPSPGRWISNFSLSLLVIYALQQTGQKSPVLPKIKHLINNAGKEDFRITEDQINCTFLRDINSQTFSNLHNTDSLHNLLLQFFEFYSSFDFNSHAISVIKGIPVSKPDHSPMYIVNPLEPQLNVSKNVSYEETQRFRIEVRNAAWILESISESDKNVNKPWGLLSIFQNHQLSIKTPSFLLNGQKTRMMDIKKLFETESTSTEAKNQSIIQEISNIKNKTKAEIKKFRSPRARRR